jgi:hypothetical protein
MDDPVQEWEGLDDKTWRQLARCLIIARHALRSGQRSHADDALAKIERILAGEAETDGRTDRL